MEFKYSARTAQYTQSVSVIKTSQLILYREIIAACSEIRTKHVNMCGKNVEFFWLLNLVVHIVTHELENADIKNNLNGSGVVAILYALFESTECA